MKHNINFQNASSEQIIEALGQRLNEIRLSLNITQAQLAKEAGVSRSTLTRLADGQPISMDSFVRVMQALKLSDQLAALLPDPSIRPVDRVRLDGNERQRASRSSTNKTNNDAHSQPWTWGDKDLAE